MKAKSYGLADLTALKKDIEAKLREQERQQREHKVITQKEQRLANEFKLTVTHVIPLKNSTRYIHPPREVKLPEPKIARTPPSIPKHKDELSDGFDTRHLRNDELGVYLRKGIPESLLKKLQKGAWPIDLRLDLHGKNTEEARIATNAFLYQAINQGARVISIIHGQGYGSQTGHAVLKQSVRNWLVQNHTVLAFCTASAPLGGQGAVLILLHQPSSP